jgi:quercetin dioxygenase-like cupin family protein
MSCSKTVWGLAALLPMAVMVGCSAKGVRMSPIPQREGFVRSVPSAQEPARLLGKDDAVGMRSGLMVLQPGQDCGWHSTENYEEMIICLAGAGEVASGDGPRRALAAGQYAYNPPQTRHNVFNTGTEVMRYIYVVAPVRAGNDHDH